MSNDGLSCVKMIALDFDVEKKPDADYSITLSLKTSTLPKVTTSIQYI